MQMLLCGHSVVTYSDDMSKTFCLISFMSLCTILSQLEAPFVASNRNRLGQDTGKKIGSDNSYRASKILFPG